MKINGIEGKLAEDLIAQMEISLAIVDSMAKIRDILEEYQKEQSEKKTPIIQHDNNSINKASLLVLNELQGLASILYTNKQVTERLLSYLGLQDFKEDMTINNMLIHVKKGIDLLQINSMPFTLKTLLSKDLYAQYEESINCLEIVKSGLKNYDGNVDKTS